MNGTAILFDLFGNQIVFGIRKTQYYMKDDEVCIKALSQRIQ